MSFLYCFLIFSCNIVCKVCNEEGTQNGNQCNQDTGHCICNDGWYGYKCLFSKSRHLKFIQYSRYGNIIFWILECKCNEAGTTACNKETGQCQCKDSWSGEFCERPSKSYPQICTK